MCGIEQVSRTANIESITCYEVATFAGLETKVRYRLDQFHRSSLAETLRLERRAALQAALSLGAVEAQVLAP
jgi:hypothetical protein